MSVLSSHPHQHLSKRARRQLEAAYVREELRMQNWQRSLSDGRNRRSMRVPMPRAGSVKQRLDGGGVVYVLLHPATGRHVGSFACEGEAASQGTEVNR